MQSFAKHTACLLLAKHTIKEVFSIIQNVFSVPHSLDLSPFWNVLSMSNKEACRSVFFCYAKCLLGVPLWDKK